MFNWLLGVGVICAVIADIMMHFDRWHRKKEKIRARIQRRLREMFPTNAPNMTYNLMHQVLLQSGTYSVQANVPTSLPRGGNARLRLYDALNCTTIATGQAAMACSGNNLSSHVVSLVCSFTIASESVVELQGCASSGSMFNISNSGQPVNHTSWKTVDASILQITKTA